MTLRRARGFTLIEILVVLVIIGLLASTVVMTLGGGASTAEQARRLAARAAYAAQESIISGAPIGLLVNDKGYAFYRMHRGKWIEIIGDRHFTAETWTGDVATDTQREGGVLTRMGHSKNAPFRPAVVFDQTGLNTPFAIVISQGDARYIVAGDDRGQITVKANDSF